MPLFLTGCFSKAQHPIQAEALAPPIVDTPPQKPVSSPADLPPPVVTTPIQTTEPVNTQPAVAPKPPVKHKKPAASNTQVASIETPGVSAIGQLSSGDASDLRQQTESSIVATERGLSGISRELSDQEQKTAAQIREFLKQARAALNSGDVDGAHTLAAKAKLLLGELSQ
ncbi:MAG: hypothetical protein ABR906_07130 [Terracidiphilus sp.]|jgi:hypothetical protein